MNVRLLQTALVAGFVASAPAATWAQAAKSPAGSCKPEISVTGTAALTENGAKENAKAQWRRTVFARYGDFYGSVEQAKGASERCVKTLLKLTRCELRAQPCEATVKGSSAAYDTATEIACVKGQDSVNCEPLVKWVQTRLNAKLGTNLKVDGSARTATQAAIKRFKKERRLAQPDEADITQGLLDALRA